LNIFSGKIISKAYGYPATDDVESYALYTTGKRVYIDCAEVEAIARKMAVYGTLELGPSYSGCFRWWSLEGFRPPWDESRLNYGAPEGENLKSGILQEIQC